ncbi:MAG TPA: efflux RND transporter periplasmic adaptor subunit [Gammaproteobacteria bacterium]|nr:efflux RND transporter periplasmic adaptor subunit [Gammaproteobacteria bacterium]
MRTRLIVVILFLCLLFGGMFTIKSCQSRQMAAMQAMPQPPATVAVATATETDWQPYLEAIGTLVATQGVFVSAEISGKVREIHFESGEPAEAGKLLLQLDDSIEQAEVQGLIAEAGLGKLEFERAAQMLSDKLGSQADYDRTRASLQKTQADLAAKRALLEKKAIRAPFPGILGIRQVDVGAYLEPGDDIVSLQRLDPLYADFSLPERYQSSISPGQQVSVQVKAWPGERFEGVISAIDPRIDSNTRSVSIRATLANPKLLLRPGMFADVRLLLPTNENVVTVPQTAIMYNPYGDAVFVVTEGEAGQTVQYRTVQTGKVRDGHIEVATGLEAGERVVSAGQLKLRNGMPVSIDNSVQLDGSTVEGQ